MVHAGRVVRPILAVDTASFYTIVEPTFLTALGIDLARAVELVEVAGLGGHLRLPCVALERCGC
jgi:hypothetical protein